MFDFEKNATVNTLDLIPTEFQGLYTKGQDNTYSISEGVRGLVDAYIGTSKTLTNEQKLKTSANGEAAKARVTLKSIKDLVQTKLGVTIDDDAVLGDTLTAQIDGLLEKINGGQALKVDLDKLRAQFDKNVQAAVTASDAKVAKMQSSLEKYLRDGAAASALAAAGTVSPDLLMPHVQQRVKVVQNGDDFIATVVDTDGNTRMNSKGVPMSVADLVAEMKTQPAFAPAFKSEAIGGSGKQPGSGNKPVVTPKEGEKPTSISRIEAGLQKGQHTQGTGKRPA